MESVFSLPSKAAGCKKNGRILLQDPAAKGAGPASRDRPTHYLRVYQFTRRPKRMTRGAMMLLMSFAFTACVKTPVAWLNVPIRRR